MAAYRQWLVTFHTWCHFSLQPAQTFDLTVPCVTYCARACRTMGISRIPIVLPLPPQRGCKGRYFSFARALLFLQPCFASRLPSHWPAVLRPLTSYIMSSDYSPTTPPTSHGARNSSYGFVVSDANIRNFAPVARIMKTALPDNAKIAKEAKECMQECVSEFISFITSEGRSLNPDAKPQSITDLSYSFREVPTREEKDCQWRRHSLRDDFTWVRELCRSTKDLSFEISRSE